MRSGDVRSYDSKSDQGREATAASFTVSRPNMSISQQQQQSFNAAETARQHSRQHQQYFSSSGAYSASSSDQRMLQQQHGNLAQPGYQPAHPSERPSMHFHVPGSHAYDMTAFVQSPSGRTEQCQVVDLDDSNYSIRFVPHESGTHSVIVRHKGVDIPGSPFEFYVGPVEGKGPRSIQVYGAGLTGGFTNERCQFEIYTKDAGAGSLSVAIEGPVKSEIDFSDKKDGTCIVSYVCPEPGEYRIAVKFNDQNVPGSPFVALMRSAFGGADSMMPQMHIVDSNISHRMNEQMSFTLDMTGRKGRLEAFIVSPSGFEQPCTLLEGANNSYTIRFTPEQSGLHLVHIKYNGREIPDSPFRVPVNESVCEPSKVFASGAGLYHGEVDRVCEFFIDTSAAGTGALAVTVDGPSKVDIDCVEIEKGYRASFVPTMVGVYIILVKFADVQIAGSPFTCHVYDSTESSRSIASSYQHHQTSVPIARPLHTQVRTEVQPVNIQVVDVETVAANADKVTAYGTGLSHAFVGEDAHFTVDTHNAGRSVLTISVQGPRKPTRDIEVRKCADYVYDVCYNLPQSGIYHLTVKWADRHILGSPFTLSVA